MRVIRVRVGVKMCSLNGDAGLLSFLSLMAN